MTSEDKNNIPADGAGTDAAAGVFLHVSGQKRGIDFVSDPVAVEISLGPVYIGGRQPVARQDRGVGTVDDAVYIGVAGDCHEHKQASVAVQCMHVLNIFSNDAFKLTDMEIAAQYSENHARLSCKPIGKHNIQFSIQIRRAGNS